MMKSCLTRLLGLLLIFSMPLSARVLETVEFDINDLQINPATKDIQFSKADQIREAGFPTIPVTRRFYYAETRALGTDITARVLTADTINPGFDISLNGADQPTSEIELEVSQAAVLRADKGLYPGSPLRVDNRVIKGRAIWTVAVFPVQFMDDGRVIFNRIVEIHVPDTNVETAIICGLPDRAAGEKSGPAYIKALSPTDDNGCPLGHQYVVVTSPDLADAFNDFIDLKLKTGYDIAKALTDSIFVYYSGVDEAEALRNYLIDFYNSGGEYVLLGGDESQVPIRYAYFYSTDSIPAPDQLMICDLYFADCDGDWETDGDGIWGEPIADHPDLGAELALGRLPFSNAGQVRAYTDKLREYLFNPGGGDGQYLNRAVFFTSDQMLDYFGDRGQQDYVAERFPASMDVDCDLLAEAPSGNAASPTGPFPSEAIANLDNGYGLINILAHGRPDGFILNSSEYNLFPKSYLLTGDDQAGQGAFDDLGTSEKAGFYYSIACMQGAIDLESVYDMAVPPVVEKLLDLDSAGAIGFIGFSRWGWVGSSYRMMASFYEHLFGDANGYPVEAMYGTYLDYPYYIDQVYGQNYYGDPSLRLYLETPPAMSLTAEDNYYSPFEPIRCRLTMDGQPLAGYPVMAQIGSDDYQPIWSDDDGYLAVELPEKCHETIEITAFSPGVISASAIFYPSVAADADDDRELLPDLFELRQNYPNPFNPATTISFTLTRYQQVSLQIYDILGRLVACPLSGQLVAGEHRLVWNGNDSDGNSLPSGVYFYRLISEEGTAVRKMLMVK